MKRFYSFETNEMRNSNIQRIYLIKESIDTSPEYQRNSEVWNLEKKQLLIDSIINDYDIPKLYFHELTKPKYKNGKLIKYAIIDGRQRIEAIWGFIEGKFTLAEDFVYYKDPGFNIKKMSYNDISKIFPDIKVIFDSYNLPIILVKTDDIDLIDEMFSRLNEAVPLNAAEKRNAIGGPMTRTINELSKNFFFENKIKVSDKRYQRKEIAVRLLFIEENLRNDNKIIDTKKYYLDEFVKKYKETNDNPKYLKERVISILKEMDSVFFDKDKLLNAQSIIPIYYLLFRQAINSNKLGNISNRKLVEFSENIKENRKIAEEDISKADFELLEFNRLSVQGTNDASSIRERLRIICKYFGIDPL